MQHENILTPQKYTGKKWLLVLISAVTLVACTGYGKFERELAVADSLMSCGYADSAFRLLCGMDSMAYRLPHTLQMKHLLLRSNAQNKSNVLFTSDSIGCLLADYYNTHGTSNERMLAHYIKGCTYRDMEDLPAALSCFNDAVAAADTTAPDCDLRQLFIIHFQIARIFNELVMPGNAVESYELAEKYARNIKDSIRLLTILNNKSDALISMGETEKGFRLKESAAESFQKMGFQNKTARIRELCIKWYIRQGNLEKAKATIEEYETHSGYFTENGEIEAGRESYYYTKGLYFLKSGFLDSAEYFFNKLHERDTTQNGRHWAAWGLSQVYHKQDQQDSVAKYAMQAIAHIDTLYSNTLYNYMAVHDQLKTQSLYNYSRHQEEMLRKEVETKNTEISRQNWIIGGSVAILALTLFSLFLRRQISQKKNELVAANEKNTRLHAQIEENAEFILSLNKQLKRRNADIETLALLKESTAQLSQKCQELETEIKRRDSVGTKSKVENEQIVKHFVQMAEKRNDMPGIDDWSELFNVVESHYPSFALRIKTCQSIGRNEYQICVLTKLGFRVNDIIYLTQTSSSNVTNMRSRMMSKIFGKEGGAKEFDARISAL